MAIIAANTGGKFELPPAGVFPAVCVQVIDLGTQRNEYDGDITNVRQVRLGWELTGEDKLGSGASHLMNDGNPFLVTEIYTLSLNEQANLRAILEGWRGVTFTDDELKGFDIAKLLGKPCLLDIEHKAKRNGGTKSKVKSAKRWPSGQPTPAFKNSTVMFSLNEFSQPVFESLSQWVRDKIASSPEYAKLKGLASEDTAGAAPAVKETPFDDEIPF